MDGWIKLHRQLKDHWLWQSERRLKWWIDILLTVNHNDSKVLIRGALVDCKRGQSIRSLESWAKDWNISKGAVRDFFKLLESDKMLTTESLQFTTRITVCKYEDYQDGLNAQETQKKRSGNAQETLRLPKQEGKEEKEGEEIKKNHKKKKIEETTLSEIEEYFLENGYSKDAAFRFLKFYSEADWFDSKGNKVKNWKQKAQSVWFKEENKIKQKQQTKLSI